MIYIPEKLREYDGSYNKDFELKKISHSNVIDITPSLNYAVSTGGPSGGSSNPVVKGPVNIKDKVLNSPYSMFKSGPSIDYHSLLNKKPKPIGTTPGPSVTNLGPVKPSQKPPMVKP